MYECVGKRKGGHTGGPLDVRVYRFVALGWYMASVFGRVGLCWW